MAYLHGDAPHKVQYSQCMNSGNPYTFRFRMSTSEMYSSGHNLRVADYIVSNILFVIGTASILLRIYSRAVIVKKFGWDDWTMTAILVSSCNKRICESPRHG